MKCDNCKDPVRTFRMATTMQREQYQWALSMSPPVRS